MTLVAKRLYLAGCFIGQYRRVAAGGGTVRQQEADRRRIDVT